MRKIQYNVPNMGGGDKKKPKMPEIQIRTFENPWGGCLNFSKMSEL